LITEAVDETMKDFLFFNRKCDPKLPVGAIEKSIEDGVITIETITKKVEENIKKYLANRRAK